MAETLEQLTMQQFRLISYLMPGRLTSVREILAKLEEEGDACTVSAIHQVIARLKIRGFLTVEKCSEKIGKQVRTIARFQITQVGRAAFLATVATYIINSGLAHEDIKSTIDRKAEEYSARLAGVGPFGLDYEGKSRRICSDDDMYSKC